MISRRFCIMSASDTKSNWGYIFTFLFGTFQRCFISPGCVTQFFIFLTSSLFYISCHLFLWYLSIYWTVIFHCQFSHCIFHIFSGFPQNTSFSVSFSKIVYCLSKGNSSAYALFSGFYLSHS